MKNNFKTCYIGDICKINENTYSNSDKWNFVNYLDTGNITKNKIENIQFINLSLEKLPSRAKRKVKNNNIIYSTVRPNQKHFGIIEEQPENFLVSTGFAVLDVDCQKANPRFVYYYLTQENYTNALHAIAEQSTSAYPSIKPSDIGNRKIILPTLEVQNKIAKVLSALDNKIELNNSINNNLEQQAQAIFNNKFVNLETVPSNWQIGNLSGIADYLNGLAMQKFRPSEDEIGIPVLKIKELRQGFCDNQSDLCSPNIKSEYLINDGDVIFSWSGTLWLDLWCSGLCGLNQHLFKVTSSKYDKWFYYFWTKYHLNKFVAIAADKATTMGHIKREDLDKSEVLIPDDETYIQLTSLLSPILELIIKNKIENRQLIQLRDTLLPKLMGGEIDVSNVDISADKLYEPANESKLSAEPYNSSGSFASASKNLSSEQSSSADKLSFNGKLEEGM